MTTRPKMNLTPRVRPIAGDVASQPQKPPSRQGLRAVTFHVSPDLLKRARAIVLEQDTSIQAVMSDLLARFVEENVGR